MRRFPRTRNSAPSDSSLVSCRSAIGFVGSNSYLPDPPVCTIKNSVEFILPNPHRLRVHEFMHPQSRQLAPVARGFYAAERQARVGFDYGVDEGAAGLDMRRQLFGARRILAPDRRAEAEAGLVGDAQRIRFARGADHARHRAEQFFVPGAGVGGDLI